MILLKTVSTKIAPIFDITFIIKSLNFTVNDVKPSISSTIVFLIALAKTITPNTTFGDSIAVMIAFGIVFKKSEFIAASNSTFGKSNLQFWFSPISFNDSDSAFNLPVNVDSLRALFA